MTTANAHNAPPSPVVGDTDTFPSHAELVRSLLAAGGIGSMTTMTSDGYPYGSLAAYSTLDDASPLVFISEMAEHTRNAHRDSRAGLFVTLPADPDEHGDPLDAPRASIVGDLAPYQPSDGEVAAHLAVHPGTAIYLDFADFGWWRLAVARARFIAGFGSMSWVEGPAIAGATPDPVMPAARGAVRHMNEDHADASLDMARHLLGLETAVAAVVHDIDRRGVTLHVTLPDGFRVGRLAFTHGALGSADDIRSAVVELTHRARGLSS